MGVYCGRVEHAVR